MRILYAQKSGAGAVLVVRTAKTAKAVAAIVNIETDKKVSDSFGHLLLIIHLKNIEKYGKIKKDR